MSEIQSYRRARLEIPFASIGLLVVAEVFFIVLSFRPLWHTDLWGHLAYGREIARTGQLPDSEPLMSLSSTRPFVDTAWLSQLVGYAAIRIWGATALQFLYAAGVTFCAGLLLWRVDTRTQNHAVSLAAAAMFVWVGWQHLIIVRPQLAGLACWMLLFAWLTSTRWNPAGWFAVPALFTVWANLHGSFPIGLVLLGCFFAGRACDLLLRARQTRILLHDRKVKRYALLLVLAAAATLVNPYGWELHAEVISVSQHPNLADLIEWKPLTSGMRQALPAGIAILALLILYGLRPRRASFVEVALLTVFGIATLCVSRMIIWWAPLAGYCLAIQANAVWNRCTSRCIPLLRQRTPSWLTTFANRIGIASLTRGLATPSPPQTVIGETQRRSPPQWSLVIGAALFIAAGCAWTPFGRTLISGKQPPLSQSVSVRTPVAAARYLKAHRPSGLIFNTYEWGDYLIWTGRRELQVFVASHAHLIPVEVWQDYVRVSRVQSGWEATLDHYGVNAIVLDAARHRPLAEQLRTHATWEVRYDDGVAVIFARRRD